MDWHIGSSSKISGEITAPGDKSITHRAIMLAALARGTSVIEDYLPADDCLRTLGALMDMGVAAERTEKTLTIHGVGLHGFHVPTKIIDAGNSGTTTRLLLGILAGQPFSATVQGDASLSHRPMNRIIDPLRMMGARIHARDSNYLPLTITGNPHLKAIEYDSPVASAQVKSCILLAGLQADGVTAVREPLRSRDHTERMLAAAGVEITVDGTTVSVKGPAEPRPQHFRVPGDISSAAFFLVLGAIARGAKITVRNVGINPTRDGILEVLKAMGAVVTLVRTFEVSGEPVADIQVEFSKLKASELGAALMPRLIDEVPIIVLAATQAGGTTVISGAQELRVKESDRLKTISKELSKMGAHIEEKSDGLMIHGPTVLHGAEVESHGDHRIAMTLAIGACIAQGETVIHGVECVETSFPTFKALLDKIVL